MNSSAELRTRDRPAGEELVADLVLLEPVDVAAVEDRVRDAIALALGREAGHHDARALPPRAPRTRIVRAGRVARRDVQVGDPVAAQVGLGRNALSSLTLPRRTMYRPVAPSRPAAPERDRADPDRRRELRAARGRGARHLGLAAVEAVVLPDVAVAAGQPGAARVHDHPVAARRCAQVGVEEAAAFGRTGRSRLRSRIRCTRRARPSLPTRDQSELAAVVRGHVRRADRGRGRQRPASAPGHGGERDGQHRERLDKSAAHG